jgi:hypothetical protein
MDLTNVVSTDIQIGMISMLSNSLIQQHNVSRLTNRITMKVAELTARYVEALKARPGLGFRSHIAPKVYGTLITVLSET